VLGEVGEPEMTDVACAYRLEWERAVAGKTSLVDGDALVPVRVRPVEVSDASGLHSRQHCSCAWDPKAVCQRHGEGAGRRCLRVCLRASACSPAMPSRRNEEAHVESCHLSGPYERESVVV
jgi:hypothetical protein